MGDHGFARTRLLRRRAGARRALAVLVALLLLSGCATVRRLPLDASLPPPDPASSSTPKHLNVAGYTTAADGVFHSCEGYVTAHGPDSLRFVVRTDSTGVRPVTWWIARAEIQSLQVRKVDGGKTVLLVLGVVTGLFVLLIIGVAASGGIGFGM